jgi:hypothetical protein
VRDYSKLVPFAAALALAACSAPPAGRAPAADSKVTVGTGPLDVTSPQRMRVMSAAQYTNTLANIFGPDLKFDTRFPPLVRTGGLLGNGGAIAGVSDSQLEQYQRTAALVAAEVTNPTHRTFLIPCKPADEKTADAACAAKFLPAIGRLLYRHPLAPEQ